MTALTIELELPDQLAEEASNAGLLSPDAIEAMLREQLKKRSVDGLFVMADRLAAVDLPPMSEEEVQAEVDAVRAEASAVERYATQRSPRSWCPRRSGVPCLPMLTTMWSSPPRSPPARR